MLGRLTSEQFAEWMAYYSLEPFGEERADFRAGIIASEIVNMAGKASKRTVAPKDFMPKFGGSRKQTPHEMLQVLKGMRRGGK